VRDPPAGHQTLTGLLVAWKSVLQIAVQDIGQLTDFNDDPDSASWA